MATALRDGHRQGKPTMIGVKPHIPNTIAKLVTDAKANGQSCVDCKCELKGHVEIECDRLDNVITGDETRGRFKCHPASRSSGVQNGNTA